MPGRPLRRRARAIALCAAVALVGVACIGSHDNGGSAQPSPLVINWAGPRVTAPLPAAVNADAFPTRWPIKHVIFIIKENRSFDQLFGRFPGVNGARFGYENGTRARIKPASDQRAYDVPHCRACAISALNNANMDGFGIQNHGAYAYTQMRPSGEPNYWEWSKRYVLADNFFASALGPSFPNHLYTIAAQSGGAFNNPRQDFNAMLTAAQNGTVKSWGCDISQPAYVQAFDTEGDETQIQPCFNFETEGDLLRSAGIPWTYYAAAPNQLGYMWSAYSAISRYRDNPTMWARYIRPVDDIVRDVKRNRLPPVTWITPRFADSEHPDYNFCYGENWTTSIVDAVMRSPIWKNTAIFITWDEYGGFYDHVPPQQLDQLGLGIRVPLLVISPYANQGQVFHEQSEFSSVLRFIEDNWGLTQLTQRDANTTNIADAFSFSSPPRPPDPLPLRTDCVGPKWAPADPSRT